MLQLWCIGFIWGGVLGAFSDQGAIHPLCKQIALFLLVASLLSSFPTKVKNLMLTLAGFLWAFSHHAPALKHPQGSFIVKQGGLFPASYQAILVTNHHQVALAFGSAETGTRGNLTRHPFAGAISSWRNIFHAQEPTNSSKPWYRSVNLFFTTVKTLVDRLLIHHQGFHRQWLEAVFFGKISKLSREVVQAFKRLGLFHLLVISGMHISFLSGFIRWLVLVPFCFAYSIRILTPAQWLWCKNGGEVLVAAILLVFVCLIGQPVAAQRSLLICCGSNLLGNFLGRTPLKQRLVGVFFAQSLLFPIGLVCESAAMSWLAYLLVIRRETTPSWRAWLIGSLKKQGIILLLCGYLWGQLSLSSLVLNLAIIPCFAPLMLASLFLLFSFQLPPTLSKIALVVIDESLQILVGIDKFLHDYFPWHYWSNLPYFIRWLLLIASIASLLRFYRGSTVDNSTRLS